MQKISLDEFCAQWVPQPGRQSLTSRLAYNASEFTTLAGAFSRRFFQMSFAQGGLYASGNRWQPRTSKWGKKFTHPTMIDTGKLKDSIKGTFNDKDHGSLKKIHEFGFKRWYTYDIQTEEVSYPEKGKRGRNRKGKGYAAIHNTDERLSPYTINQFSTRKPVQRQFIGFSDRLDEYINEHYVPIIFKKFP